MRWIAFAILLYIVTALQTTMAPFIEVHAIRPDLMVILAVYYALLAPPRDALLACWFVGLAYDLTGLSFANHSNLGVHSFALGLIALFIVRLRELAFRESALTQLLLTFFAKLTLAVGVGMHMLYVLDRWDRFGEVLTVAIWASAYTAVLAPYGHWVLLRLRGMLGIGVTHRLPVR